MTKRKKPVSRMLKSELMQEVRRQAKEIRNLSKQPRFESDTDRVFGAVYRWFKMAEIEEPPYNSNSRVRDTWLSQFWHREPHIAGIINSVIAIDKNRGWTLTGGRNQVRRYVNILHNAEGGRGWRSYMGKGSLAFYTTDLGRIDETGRDGREGPLRALYNVDSTRCRLTGNVDKPLGYTPKSGGEQMWTDWDFFRMSSMETYLEDFNGLGYCALSRALELTKIMVAIYQHDQEKLGFRAPRGLLFLHNVSQSQWDTAMLARDAKLDSREMKYYGAVSVIASSGMEQADAKLVALSQLPDNFDQKTFVDLTMYGYALCFGYDPSEFWPVQYGSLGRGKETEIQHVKATGKGGVDHILSYQEMLQEEIPSSIEFDFDQRDDEGEMLSAEVMKAKIEAIGSAYETGLQQFVPLISREEARSLLAEMGVIPYEWTELEEDVEVTDVEDPESATEQPPEEAPLETLERDRLLSSDKILRACEEFPRQEIVRYHFPSKRYTVLFKSGAEATRNRYNVVVKKRQDESEVFYKGDGFQITDQDVERSVKEARQRTPEMAELIEAPEKT